MKPYSLSNIDAKHLGMVKVTCTRKTETETFFQILFYKGLLDIENFCIFILYIYISAQFIYGVLILGFYYVLQIVLVCSFSCSFPHSKKDQFITWLKMCYKYTVTIHHFSVHITY